MKNITFHIFKIILHCVTIFISFYGALPTISGLFDSSVSYSIIAVSTVLLLFIIEVCYAYGLSATIAAIRNKLFAKAILPCAFILIFGSVGVYLSFQGSYQTPFYLRADSQKARLTNVDSLTKYHTHLIDSVSNANRVYYKSQTRLLTAKIKRYDTIIASTSDKWLRASYLARQEKLINTLSSTTKTMSDRQQKIITSYKQDFTQAKQSTEAANKIALAKANDADTNNANNMAKLSIAIQIFIVLLSLIVQPVNLYTQESNANSERKALQINMKTVVNNVVTTVTQQLTINKLLKICHEYEYDKLKHYLDSGDFSSTKYKYAKLLVVPILEDDAETIAKLRVEAFKVDNLNRQNFHALKVRIVKALEYCQLKTEPKPNYDTTINQIET